MCKIIFKTHYGFRAVCQKKKWYHVDKKGKPVYPQVFYQPVGAAWFYFGMIMASVKDGFVILDPLHNQKYHPGDVIFFGPKLIELIKKEIIFQQTVL